MRILGCCMQCFQAALLKYVNLLLKAHQLIAGLLSRWAGESASCAGGAGQLRATKPSLQCAATCRRLLRISRTLKTCQSQPGTRTSWAAKRAAWNGSRTMSGIRTSSGLVAWARALRSFASTLPHSAAQSSSRRADRDRPRYTLHADRLEHFGDYYATRLGPWLAHGCLSPRKAGHRCSPRPWPIPGLPQFRRSNPFSVTAGAARSSRRSATLNPVLLLRRIRSAWSSS